ncbi:RNA polymerase sigma factor [Agarilytica rhodophyticola]|uniref:RNA polymerase sigma factor n=1 Tax=Agarilytica rhodophyticola TaxID=1737490 RepID=UPI000B342F58|nr:sigma-70 family RNA polymerase sigma factor [Agarilytica rhodophyticola]
MDSKNEELVALIARCAIKDQAALKLLYERVSPYLNAVAYRILKSDEMANDVLQEAFIQIWQNADAYRPHMAKPLTWMTSILRYRALDRLDKEKRYQQHIQNDDDSEDIFSTIPANSKSAPESTVQSSQVSQHIMICLGGLSEKIRESIKLAYLEGFSREEIANKYDTNPNTVKSWLRRGSERLKKCLETKIEMTA